MYALRTSAAISGMRGGVPVNDDDYERSAPIGAAKILIGSGTPGAVVGSLLGGPIGGAIGFMLSAALFGSPRALEVDRQHNERQRGRR